ncbi:hypothetical protein CLOSCI_03589 [[Clostridium] scindens ATCC 35704]|nr:hypothetical protein CLOSCI_03589 [[Clostridium] scindens ATCC 35704]
MQNPPCRLAVSLSWQLAAMSESFWNSGSELNSNNPIFIPFIFHIIFAKIASPVPISSIKYYYSKFRDKNIQF